MSRHPPSDLSAARELRPLSPLNQQSFTPKRIRGLRLGGGFLLLGTLLALYLAGVALLGGSVAGCGPGDPCSRVTQSRWAYWLGIPVSVPAAAIYLLLVFLARTRVAALREQRSQEGSLAIIGLSVVVVLSALWFVSLQLIVIRAFCIYCTATHLVAAIGASILLAESLLGPAPGGRCSRRETLVAGAGALGGFILLVMGQLLVSRPANLVQAIEAPGMVGTPSTPTETFSLYGGRFLIDLKSVPQLGVRTAPHIVISLFDYTCSHCRDLHVLLEQAREQFGGRLLVVVLPMPLDARCNRLVTMTSVENLNACEYARLALAVWRIKPEAFARFNSWLFAPTRPPSLDDARHNAGQLVGKVELKRSLDDGWIDRQLQFDMQLFEANSKRAGEWQLPQLIVGKSLSVGSITSMDQLNTLLQDEYGLTTGDSQQPAARQ